MKLYDLEHHFYIKDTIDAMQKRKGYPNYDAQKDVINWYEGLSMPQGPLLDKLLDLSEERVKLMDELGISTALLSTSQGVEDLDTEDAIELARKTNDAVYELTQRYPGRFLGSAILPTKFVDEAVEELERCAHELNFVCWHTHSNLRGASLEEERFRPLFRKAAELGVFIYLHPNLPNMPDLFKYGFTVSGPGAGFTIDTIAAILKLIASGVFDEVPDTRMLIGHFGEAIPFLMDRIDNRFSFIPNENLKNRNAPSYYFHNNIQVTTSGNMSKEAFECTKNVFGIENIMFGSDYPFEDPREMVDFVHGLDITEEERELLFFKNAEKLLGNKILVERSV